MNTYRIIWNCQPTAELRRQALETATKHSAESEPPLWIVCGSFLLLLDVTRAEPLHTHPSQVAAWISWPLKPYAGGGES